ncbi:MAG TPA: ABC transporter ATP-binding protein [Candidatus Limnocylindrales bacterium]|nr:ABC transporter ATP-binding protein [Candidatus Limnocylindrales bacterium]
MRAAADDPSPAIEVDDLRKSYDGRPVLRGVSFRIGAGEIFAILGPNGVGKTTTVEIIEGYRRVDGGDVRVLGVDPARAGREHRARVGLMLQGGGGIDPRMTASEVVRLHGRFHADPRDADELLAEVGLSGDVARTRYRRLSGGERQRVGLAVALVGRPDVVILDEPTAGMDVEARAATRETLLRLRDDGVTILLTSHDLTDVERLADRIAIIDRGRIVALGGPEELASAVRPVLRFRLSVGLAEPDRLLLEARLGDGRAPLTLHEDGGPGRYRLEGADPDPALIASLAAGCAAGGALIVELRSGGGSLEERYLELIGSLRDEEQQA